MSTRFPERLSFPRLWEPEDLVKEEGPVLHPLLLFLAVFLETFSRALVVLLLWRLP